MYGLLGGQVGPGPLGAADGSAAAAGLSVSFWKLLLVMSS